MCNTLTKIQAYNIALTQAKRVLQLGYFKGKRINFRDLAKVGLAIMEIESNNFTCAKNPKSTATGLFQVTEATRLEMESKYLKIKPTAQANLKNANYGALIGLSALAYQYIRYGYNWNDAVIGFNQGNAGASAKQRAKSYIAKYNSAYNSNDYALLDKQTDRDISFNNTIEFP